MTVTLHNNNKLQYVRLISTEFMTMT